MGHIRQHMSTETTNRASEPIPEGIEHLPKAAVFAAVVRHGSFTRAASELRMARSTISQHVLSLEEAMGVRLLERTTRRMRLTQEGEMVYESVSAALRAWGDVQQALAESRSEPTGTLRVTAPSGIATTLVAQAGGEFLRTYPNTQFELHTDDAALDLVRQGIDLAIRMAPMRDSSLVAKRIGATPKVLVGGPQFSTADAELDGDSLQQSLERTLETSGYVSHASVPHSSIQLYRGDEALSVNVRARAIANSGESQVAMLEAGAGIALMPRLLVKEALATGRLVHLFQSLRGNELPIYAVYPQRRLLPARVPAFLRLVESRLEG